TVPAGSILIIRASGPVNLEVVTTGGLTEAKAESKPGAQPVAIAGTEEHRFTVSDAGTVTLRSVVANDLTWQFTAIPDRPPTIALVARDEGANEGKSEPFKLTLPERPFSKPTARALIEQRRSLALDGDAQARVLNALDALTFAPERFNIESKVYLGLRSIFWQ